MQWLWAERSFLYAPFLVIAVHVGNQDEEDVIEWFENHGVTFPAIKEEPPFPIMRSYVDPDEGLLVPHNYIIGRDRVIKKDLLSAPDCTELENHVADVASMYDYDYVVVEPSLFDWDRVFAISYWVKNHWDLIFPHDPTDPIPEPHPKFHYSFSADWCPEKLPSYLSKMFRIGFDIISQSERTEFAEKSILRIIELLEEIPAGLRFTKPMRQSTLKSLKEFKDSKGGITFPAGKLLESINAIDLDWRIPPLPKKVKSGKKITIGFEGVSCITFRNIDEAGRCVLRVEGRIPALAKGFESGWPIASYHFDHKGKLSENVEISFYIGGIHFPGQSFSPRLLEWNGKSYKDITTDVDLQRKVIYGRTNELSTYVIMNAI
ncbi:MAG: hypothetical protein JSV33_05985 [bacterium]|nr:MAG: hypothetical protein JSV33_05985 [bacterium]